MSLEMKIAIIFVAAVLSCDFTEGNRYRRDPDDLQQSYIVHYDKKGQALSVAGFDDFVRAFNSQRGILDQTASSYANGPAFPVLQANPSTSGLMTTTTERTTPHQPRPLATGTLSTPAAPLVIATGSPKHEAYVTVGSTASPLKLPHEMSGTTPMPEASVSTDKPTLTQALGNDGAATPGIQRLPSPSDVSNLVTPGENSPFKITVSGLGFPHGTGLTSKVISLQQQQQQQQPLLNYAQPPVALHSYLPAQQTSYLHTLPSNTYQSATSAHYAQPETFNYASYPNQNLAIQENSVPIQIVRQEPSLIDIGQGLGHGYRSTTRQEFPVSLGGWGGVDYRGHRSIPVVKPVLGITKFGHGGPPSSRVLSKIGFGIGSW